MTGKKEQDEMLIQTTIPTGSMAKLVLPAGVKSCLINNEIKEADNKGNIWIENGIYEIIYSEL
ncbi:MAG: hypothetical protein Q7U86_01385 [Draconibacterium sp.]|nr:hypothetical protein [Draconibacterium sp.]